MAVKEKRNSWLQKYASTSRSARTFCRVFVLLSANGLVNDHNLGDTVCIPLIGLSVTFNPLRMPLSTLPSLGSAPVDAIFNRAAMQARAEYETFIFARPRGGGMFFL